MGIQMVNLVNKEIASKVNISGAGDEQLYEEGLHMIFLRW